MAEKRKCFKHFTEEEIRIKRQNTIPKATLKIMISQHGKHIDLTTDQNFKRRQHAFKDTCKELKKFGKGIVHSYPEIAHSGGTHFHFV